MKIVTVCEDRDLRWVTERSVVKYWPGADLVQTDTGREGIRIVSVLEPDIVILSRNLPDMDGFVALTQIRTFSNVPLIMVTDQDNEEDISEGLDLGADDYIVKPVSEDGLALRAKAVLRRISPIDRVTIHQQRDYDWPWVGIQYHGYRADDYLDVFLFHPHFIGPALFEVTDSSGWPSETYEINFLQREIASTFFAMAS